MSCSFARPGSSAEGLADLTLAVYPATSSAGAAPAPAAQPGCADIARSGTGPTLASSLAYIPFAVDGVAGTTGPGTCTPSSQCPSFSVATPSNGTVIVTPVPTAITTVGDFSLSDLETLYDACGTVTEGGVTYDPTATIVGDVPIDLYLPPPGSDVSGMWANALGFDPAAPAACVHTTIAAGPLAADNVPYAADDGTALATDPNGFGPFSIAGWIAQSNGHGDHRHGAVLQTLDGAPPLTVGGTLNSGFPITGDVYSVALASRVTNPGDPLYALLNSASAANTLCDDQAAILSYGFALLPSCGSLVTADADAGSVSCASAGTCAAAGYYTDANGDAQAFVADETAGNWGPEQPVPGAAALNAAVPAAQVVLRPVASSCAPGGAGNNCATGGYYTDANGNTQAWVADEVNGVWGNAQQVPNTNVLNRGGRAAVTSVSCPTPGAAGNNCAVVGFYTDGNGNRQAWVADEVNGVWGKAQTVPNTDVLNVGANAVAKAAGKPGPNASVTWVSCATPVAAGNNCAAGGSYTDANGDTQAWVADEVKGVWGKAQQVPGTAALNVGAKAGANASVLPVSCATPGAAGNNCAAGGYYTDGKGAPQAWVADEKNGVWGNAQQVPNTNVLNAGAKAAAGPNASVLSVSCTTPVAAGNNCAAGGYYTDANGNRQAWVADEKNGVWGNAQQVPNTNVLNAGAKAAGPNASVLSVSCTTPVAAGNNCAAGGFYADGNGNRQAWVADEVNGVWGKAQQVPGTPALNVGGKAGPRASVLSVSCAAPGAAGNNCTAGGFYADANGAPQPWVADEKNGVWGNAKKP